MPWLYAVFVVSVLALLWAAFSVARHIRRDEGHAADPASEPPSIPGPSIPGEKR